MRYREWKLINEALAGVTPLGLSNPHTLGGPLGTSLREAEKEDLLDDEDDEMEDEDGDEEETDLFGDEEMDPDMDFPPDDSEDMDGLPTPDEEMLGDDEMDDMDGEGEDDMSFLNDIDPDLAGLDDDEAGLGDEMLGGDHEEPDADDMGGEPDMDMDDMGDEDLEGLGLDDDDMDGMGDVAVGDDQGDDMHGDFMDRMADYCGRYMADYMVSHMKSHARKHMKAESTQHKKKKGRKYMCGKGCDDGIKSREDMTDMAANHFGKKSEGVGTYEETADSFFSTLRTAAKGDHNVRGWSGLSEDMLLQMNNPNDNQPKAGEQGFAPQGRIGSISGGYTQDDLSDIETMPY